MSHASALRFLGRRRGYTLAFAVELLLVGTGIATLKLAAEAFGTAGFGEFAVARRTISVCAFPLLLGLGVGVARYVAYAASPPQTYLLAALGIVAPVVGGFTVGASLLTGPVALVFFGSEAFAYLVPPTLIAIVGVSLHSIAHAYFAGQLRMGAANTLQLMNLGVAPVLAVLLSGGSASRAIALLGLVSLAASGVALLPGLVRVLAAPPAWSDLALSARHLLTYGAPRVPGDFAHFALFSVPTFVVAHRAGIEAAGYLSFGLSLVHLVDAPFAAGRTLLLPIVSRLAASGRRHEIERLLRRTAAASVLAASAVVASVELALDPVVVLLLGPSFSAAAEASRWLLLGAIPYALYSVLRGAVDALAVWPHNSINLAIALTIGLVLLAANTFVPTPVAVTVAFTALAALTLWASRSSLDDSRSGVDLGPAAPSMPE